MKMVASMFSGEARKALRDHLSIDLSDDHDYTEDELEDLYDRITEEFPYVYGDDGEPLPLGSLFESIIDVFADRKLVQFS